MLCVRALVLSLSLSLSFGRLSSFLVFDRAFAVGREEDERNAADGAEREREIPRRRRHSRCPFGSFKRDLDGTKIGDEKMSNTTTRVLMNTGTNDFDVRFLSPFTKFSLLRIIEANGRERRKKAWRSLVRSFG